MDNIQKRSYQSTAESFDNVNVGAVAFVSSLLLSLFTLIYNTFSYKQVVRADKVLSKKVNDILKSGNKWIVRIINTKKEVNAFCFGCGRNVYVTSALLKLMNDRETIAVLLHEVYHATKKHTLKHIVCYSTFMGIVFTVITPILAGVSSLVILMFVVLLRNTFDVFWNISIARLMELKSDSYAAKCGYGKELISALRKLERVVKSNKIECTTLVCKIVEKIDRVLDEHPETEKRVENILRTIAKTRNLSLQNIKRIILKKD